MIAATNSLHETVDPPRAAPTRRLRVAYLTTEYPKVSHTFIRREIVELERRGHHVLRLAIRNSGGAVADAADRVEAEKTFHCLSQPLWRIVLANALVMATRPLAWYRALRVANQMHRRSDRGFITHMAYLAEAALLLRVVKKNKIEHVHVHFGTNSAAVARLVRILGGPPYSMTVHGPNEFETPYGFSLGEKVMEASFVLAISNYCATQLKRWTPQSHWNKIHIVHCTVGSAFFDAFTPIPQQTKTFVCVGRLTAQKGQHLLIEAVHRLVQAGEDFHVILAGDGEMRQELEAHIAALNLQPHITITGWIDESTVRNLIGQARVLVQPSFAEGLPVVIMEAMAMGRPVISTKVAAIPELVRQGETGWLLPSGDLHALVNAMREALHMPIQQLNEMGAAARQLVIERHSTDIETTRLEQVFEQYIEKSEAQMRRVTAEDHASRPINAMTCT